MTAPHPELLAVHPEIAPDVDHIVTEDDTPVDNFASEKQQRLFAEVLCSSWPGPGGGRTFLVATNVGLFPSVRKPPLVPDAFLSLDVTVADDWWKKSNRSYFFWEFGKAPELVIEIVSNREGDELGRKKLAYAQMGILYYVVWDPSGQISDIPLQVFELCAGTYVPRPDAWLPAVGLGLTLWFGTYEAKEDTWLRWCDHDGRLIPTGAERAEQERQRAEQERQRADQAQHRADEQQRLAERLAEKLRALGVDPDQAP